MIATPVDAVDDVAHPVALGGHLARVLVLLADGQPQRQHHQRAHGGEGGQQDALQVDGYVEALVRSGERAVARGGEGDRDAHRDGHLRQRLVGPVAQRAPGQHRQHEQDQDGKSVGHEDGDGHREQQDPLGPRSTGPASGGWLRNRQKNGSRVSCAARLELPMVSASIGAVAPSGGQARHDRRGRHGQRAGGHRDQEPGQVDHGVQRARARAGRGQAIRQVTQTSAARPMPSPTATSSGSAADPDGPDREQRQDRHQHARGAGRGATMSVAVARATGQMPMPRPPSGVATTAAMPKAVMRTSSAENDSRARWRGHPYPSLSGVPPHHRRCGHICPPAHDDRPTPTPRGRTRGVSVSLLHLRAAGSSPTRPSIASRIRSAWPVCRAYSSTMSTSDPAQVRRLAPLGARAPAGRADSSARNAATAARERATAASHSALQLLGGVGGGRGATSSPARRPSRPRAHGSGMFAPN